MVKSSFYDPTTGPYYSPTDSRRVALVTGGNGGIGYFTCLHLYLHGFDVYVAGRSESKVSAAIDNIKKEAAEREAAYTDEQRKVRHLGKLYLLHIDCADLQSVADCATEFMASESKLHVLINNAGIMGVPFLLTKDGFEIQYQVNLLAPMVLTTKLLPALKKATDSADPPRVVNVTSLAHCWSYKYFQPGDKINCTPNALYTWVRYGNSKRALIEYTAKFAQEHPDILAFAVHPGVISETELYSHWRKMPLIGSSFNIINRGIGKIIGVNSEEGSLASLRAALDPVLNKSVSGHYMETGGVLASPSSIAQKQSNIDLTYEKNFEFLKEKNFV